MEVFEKSQTIDPEVRAYVYSLVSAIGGSSPVDEGRYVLGDDALACLKDIRRWLKLYDTKLDRFDVKRVLAEANLVKGDLLEILGQWRDDDESNTLRRKVALGSLELLTELTWPLILVSDRATVNHVRHLPYIQLAQVEYKRAILHHESGSIFRKAISAAVPALSVPRRDRSPREEGIINLVLYLFRNLVLITLPANLSGNGDDEDISRSEVIHALHQQDVLQLVLTICSGMGEDFDEQDIVVMEMLFHLLKGVDPRVLYQPEQQVTSESAKYLRKMLQAEKSMLANQARNAPSRHNRFGTMIWVKQADEKVSTLTGQDVISSEQKTLNKMDATKKWNRPRHHGKHVDVPGDGTDFAPVHLDKRATGQLRDFVSDFLDSSFNPLFVHLRRAIEREADRVKEDHRRQFFYLIHWFLTAEEARRQNKDPSDSTQTPSDPTAQVDTPFSYVAGVLTQETFVLLGRTMQQRLDEKGWHDLHTCILAFTRIMLTVWAMSESPSDDDQDIAENIQSRIFYEESTHDRILQILRGYQEGRQDFAYLDACTDLAHVFIRLLERYSKVNVDMFIRSKRRARRKARAAPKGNATIEGLEETAQPEDDGAGDEVEAHREVQERKFDFSRFAARFVNDGSIGTFIALLSRYRDLSEEQLKRCHRFFYRVAFKMERAILLYRVDVLHLFNRLIQGPDGLDSVMKRKAPQFKEWEELVKQIFRRCIKKLEERPELYVELLFTKTSSTLFYLEHGYDKEVVKSTPRPPAELEIKPGMDHEQQIGVAVGVLVDQGKLDVLIWIKTVLMDAIAERRSWADQDEAVRLLEQAKEPQMTTVFGGSAQNSTDDTTEASGDKPAESADSEKTLPPSITVKPDSDERRVATFRDKHLRLLLKTLAFQRLGAHDDPDTNWIVPSELTADTLEADLQSIRKFEFDPPTYEDNRAAESFIRNESAARRNAYEKETSDDDGDSDVDESLFVPGGPTRRSDDEHEDRPKKHRRLQRKRADVTEEELAERSNARKQREKERDAKIKSSLFVTESDDEDDERHADFFQMEKQRRGTTANATKAALMAGRTGHGEEPTTKTKKRKSDGAEQTKQAKKSKLASLFEEDSGDDSDSGDYEEALVEISSRESTPASEHMSEDEEADAMDKDDETPLSSQSAQQGEQIASSPIKSAQPLNPVSGNARRTVLDSDDEDIVQVKGARRSGRPIIIDDDSD